MPDLQVLGILTNTICYFIAITCPMQHATVTQDPQHMDLPCSMLPITCHVRQSMCPSQHYVGGESEEMGILTLDCV